MNTTQISILRQVTRGTTDKDQLKENVHVKDWQLNASLKELGNNGYLSLDGDVVNLSNSTKSVLVKEISQNFDIAKILKGANEIILSYLTEPMSINSLERFSGLSRSTIYRTISDFETLGIIKRNNETIELDTTHEKIKLLAEILKTERENRFEPNAEIIFQDSQRILKKVPKGKVTDGALTGFSLFSDYGIEYHTLYDFYIKQDDVITHEDILIHALYSAARSGEKNQITMAIIFYLKNKEKMDILEIRRKASEFKITSLWLDVEAYIRNNDVNNKELFLPRNEFIEKVTMYEIPSTAYVLPEGFPNLFEEISTQLSNEIRIFLIGGENMRIKGLKPRTKDCDIVVENKDDYDVLMNALTKIGYKPKSNLEYSKEDLRIYPSIILEHTNRSRIDLYTKKILRTLSLSSKMIERTEFVKFGKLEVGILRNEDVFLLKSVTSREGDIQDMAMLARNDYVLNGKFQQQSFDWDIVWNEILQQEKENHLENFTGIIRQNIEWLIEQTNIIPPFRNKLQRHVLDVEIIKLLREGPTKLKDIVEFLEDDKISNQSIRNRIDALVTSKTIKKIVKDNEVILYTDEQIFPEPNVEINSESLEQYLRWRFPMKHGATQITYQKMSETLNHIGFEKIGQLDEIIRNASSALKEYEETYRKHKLNQIGALRICIGLTNPKLGLDGTSDFYVLDYKKFAGLVRS